MVLVALLYLFSTIFLHLLIPSFPITIAKTPPPYTPTDYFLLNCGSSYDSTSSLDGRHWEGDSNSKFSPRDIQSTSSSSSSSNASQLDLYLSQVPYTTARIFDRQSKFTYSFPVSPGPKFLRLYFYPTSCTNHDQTKSFFSVTANNFTLLSNFNAYLSISATYPSTTYLVKEFIVDVQKNQNLDVTFIPSPSSYAFINAIEVISMPNKLYISNPFSFVSGHDNPPFFIDNPFAFETLYRLNVGGNVVSNIDDTGMFRSWSKDEDYIFGKALGTTPHRSNVTIKYTEDTPPYTAPEIIYNSSRTMGENPNINLQYNLTWIFQVDAGFPYMVRLHFCETQLEVTQTNQRVFRIFIYNQTAEERMDVIELSGGNGIPVYKDYILLVPGKPQSKQDLWLALQPNIISKPDYADAILNGVEILKLNQSNGNLAGGPNPESPMVGPGSPTSSESEKNLRHKNYLSPVMIAVGIPIGALVAILIYICLLARFHYRRKRADEQGIGLSKLSLVPFFKMQRSNDKNMISKFPLERCRDFSIVEIKAATDNFDRRLVIGNGRFGNMYKGYIDGGSTAVAIKRLKPSSKQGLRQFWTEIQMLSMLRHVNLVALIGYCDGRDEMFLVYEYVASGTLRSHLYGTDSPALTWKQRLQICIDTAHGLNYLHTGARYTIIHSNVKSTNILLDERLSAKVSYFGLSKLDPINVSKYKIHFNNVVTGGFGYVDPEYFRMQKLTEKSDVYSFGVVLFEVLCSRPTQMPGLPKDQVSLAQWARKCYHSGKLDQIIDPCLRGEIASECLHKFGEIAESCISDHGIERPAMKDVVKDLQFALQIQENAEKGINNRHVDERKMFPHNTCLHSSMHNSPE